MVTKLQFSDGLYDFLMDFNHARRYFYSNVIIEFS